MMAKHLTAQVRTSPSDHGRRRGDLSKKITWRSTRDPGVEKTRSNTMVDQLSSFAAGEPAWPAKVGTEGILGGQAVSRASPALGGT